MPFRPDTVLLLAAALATLAAPRATSQRPAQSQSQSATVAVSLRVLPHASFERGAEDSVSPVAATGVAGPVGSAGGVRTRMTYHAATRVVVSGTALRGPGGTEVEVRFGCAFGGGMSVSAAEPFDCVNGLVAIVEGARTTTIPLSIVATLSPTQALDVPPGVYRGRVTLTATSAGY